MGLVYGRDRVSCTALAIKCTYIGIKGTGFQSSCYTVGKKGVHQIRHVFFQIRKLTTIKETTCLSMGRLEYFIETFRDVLTTKIDEAWGSDAYITLK